MSRALTLLDWKSSAFIGAEMYLQAGAYFGTTHVRHRDKGWIVQAQRPTQGAIIKIGPEFVGVATREVKEPGTWKVIGTERCLFSHADLETAHAHFVECLNVFYWMVSKGFATVPDQEKYRVLTRQFVSTTYVIQHVIAKPGLLQWYAKMAKEGKDPNAERDQRGAEGTRWHKMIESFLRGKPVDLSQAPDAMTKTMERFARWSQAVKLDPVPTVGIESAVCHMELGYAGTRDCLGMAELEEG